MLFPMQAVGKRQFGPYPDAGRRGNGLRSFAVIVNGLGVGKGYVSCVLGANQRPCQARCLNQCGASERRKNQHPE